MRAAHSTHNARPMLLEYLVVLYAECALSSVRPTAKDTIALGLAQAAALHKLRLCTSYGLAQALQRTTTTRRPSKRKNTDAI
eukprot:5677774-Prymnesium_polylepis.1